MSNEHDNQGAREALVEQLAEAMRAEAEATGMLVLGRGYYRVAARAVLPLVAAQVEAAVSVVRAERDHLRGQRDWWRASHERWYDAAIEAAARAESAESERDALREKVTGATEVADSLIDNSHPIQEDDGNCAYDGVPADECGVRLIRAALSDPTTELEAAIEVCCGDVNDRCATCPERVQRMPERIGSAAWSDGSRYPSCLMPEHGWEQRKEPTLAPSPAEGADFGSAYVPDLSADFAPGGDWHNALPSPAEGTGEHGACARRVESGVIHYACGVMIEVGTPDAYAMHVARWRALTSPAPVVTPSAGDGAS